MIPLREAQEFVLSHCSPSRPEWHPLDVALDCIAADAVQATEPVPPFLNSSMDGYAVRADDTRNAPVTLSVVGVIMAGSVLDGAVGSRQAARIMTGAPLPAGADAVCMVEDTVGSPDGRHVTISRRVEPGQFVRQPGQDVAAGDVLVPAGTCLGPAHVGMLASQGFENVLVHPRPKVGVLSTGDELYTDPGPLPPGRIRDTNRHTLVALSRREGWDVCDLGVVGDDEHALMEVLTTGAASTCHAIVTSGGVSVGDLDLVRVVLEQLSQGAMRWMQVAIKPAKPFAFGILASSGAKVFALPGNPVSAMVSFELFVRPALRKMGGHRDLHRPVVTARTPRALGRQPDGKLHLLRARVSSDGAGDWSVVTAEAQESHQLHAMADANALVMLPSGEGVGAGDRVQALLIGTGESGTARP